MTPEEMIEYQLAILLRHVTSTSIHKKIGVLDRSAYLLLHQIGKQGSASVKALADSSKLDISTVSRQTAALEQREYVYRIPDPNDGRSYSLKMTPYGEEQLAEHRKARAERISVLTATWTPEERQVFGELLTKLNLNFL
ncbi:MarR family winged helix-turn-helix transcriptional regulator [Paenibacillus ferrarius]|uniref:MarR family winged helix-turn-helix transcriptional regulator n=1 Tax=Paenibacillus ferrarius TaxID=1469647 RepID=UPI003D2BEE80